MFKDTCGHVLFCFNQIQMNNTAIKNWHSKLWCNNHSPLFLPSCYLLPGSLLSSPLSQYPQKSKTDMKKSFCYLWQDLKPTRPILIFPFAEASMNKTSLPYSLVIASPSSLLITLSSSRSLLLPTTSIGGSLPVPSVSYSSKI